jgi:hypothetical protein
MLGGEGWLTDPELIMSRIYMHVFLTDHSQSNIYQGNIISIQYILSNSGDDPVDISSNIQAGLKAIYSKYYENVDVSFEQLPSDSYGLSEAIMVFGLSVKGELDGVIYTLDKVLQTDKSSSVRKFKELG